MRRFEYAQCGVRSASQCLKSEKPKNVHFNKSQDDKNYVQIITCQQQAKRTIHSNGGDRQKQKHDDEDER